MKKIKLIITNIYASILPIICGFLGAFGGATGGNKAARRYLIPLLITGLAYMQTESILVLTILSIIGWFSLGYGIPGNEDEGSALGRFYYNLFNRNHFLADIFTRGTIGLLVTLSLISIPIIKHNWFIYILCGLGICSVYSFISWRNLSQYKLFKIQLNWSETLTYGLITLLAVLIIKIGG